MISFPEWMLDQIDVKRGDMVETVVTKDGNIQFGRSQRTFLPKVKKGKTSDA